MTYHPNPERGCGTKSTNACYAEGGELSADGILKPWVWLLGDGINDNLYLEVPPRQIIMINTIATITLRSLIGIDWPYEILDESQELVNHLHFAMKHDGIADHVGAISYSPFSFAVECMDLGPSRRISKDMAQELAKIISLNGPIPMLFTHNRIPVFRHEEDRVRALGLVKECYESDAPDWEQFDYFEPTWIHERWGLYKGNWPGHTHYMVPILTTLSIMDQAWNKVKDSEEWQRIKEFFNDANHVRFMEQSFGMSWLTQITYTLDENGQADPEMVDVPGINILDLDAIEELDDKEGILEEANEQVKSAPLGAD